jgi:hypothetical protein
LSKLKKTIGVLASIAGVTLALVYALRERPTSASREVVPAQVQSSAAASAAPQAQRRSTAPAPPRESMWQAFVASLRQNEGQKDAADAPVSSSEEKEAEERAANPTDPYQEAADWETLSDEERAERGLTKAALFGATQGISLALLSKQLKRDGLEEYGERAFRLRNKVWALERGDSGLVLDDVIAEIDQLISDLESAQLNKRGIEAHLDKVKSRQARAREPKGFDVDDKTAVERESAITGRNQRQKDHGEAETKGTDTP